MLDGSEEVTRTMAAIEVMQFGDVSAKCAVETAAVVGQCNEHAQFVLGVGLVIGFAVGACAMMIGRWYRGRKE